MTERALARMRLLLFITLLVTKDVAAILYITAQSFDPQQIADEPIIVISFQLR